MKKEVEEWIRLSVLCEDNRFEYFSDKYQIALKEVEKHLSTEDLYYIGDFLRKMHMYKPSKKQITKELLDEFIAKKKREDLLK